MLNKLIRWYNNEFKQDTLYTEMEKVSENSPWHRERNIAIHTDMVFQNYLTIAVGPDRDLLLGGLAAIFHDVGKPIACKKNGIKFKPERGNYLSFGGHEQISARMWEDYASANWERMVEIFDLNTFDIYAVSWLIEYHLPWGIRKADKVNNIAMTSMFIADPHVYTNLLLADTLGRISDDQVEKRKKVRDWIAKFHDEVLPRLQFSDTEPVVGQPVMVMPIGASGTGKSTYRNKIKGYEMYSWDDLRLEFYSSDYEEAYKLATEDKNFGKKVNARFMELVKTGKDIYVDNVNRF